MSLRLVLWLSTTLLLGGAGPAHADGDLSACRLTVAEVDALSPNDVLQAMVDGDLTPSCRAQTLRAAKRTVELIAAADPALVEALGEDHDDPEDADVATALSLLTWNRFARGWLVRDAVQGHRFDEATAQVGELRTALASLRDRMRASEMSRSDEVRADYDDGLGDFDRELADLLIALAGSPLPPVEIDTSPIDPDWMPRRYRCAFDGFANAFGGAMPSPEDVLAARGDPEQALQRVLDRDWRRSAYLGAVPPELVDYARIIHGNAGLRREFLQAAEGIRVDDGPGGTYAQMPLFGRWLPIPVGTVDGSRRTPTSAASADELRSEWQQRFEAALARSDTNGGDEWQ